jgi:hypothetical protein
MDGENFLSHRQIVCQGYPCQFAERDFALFLAFAANDKFVSLDKIIGIQADQFRIAKAGAVQQF